LSENKSIVVSSTRLPANLTIHDVLDQIRPAWQGKSLIQRVLRILPVDPSSACQRLFNAAIHDLRDKVVIAGVDLAKEAATNNKLPPINKEENVEEYPTSKLIDLCYRIGLLTRPEWRRLHRSYEIRRDLEHEDDEYEAALEDCMYIFKTSIDIVLSKDPIELLKVKDIKEIIEEPVTLTPSSELLENYERAPQARQKEICLFLISVSLNKEKPDIVRENSYELLSHLVEILTQPSVKIELADYFQQKMGRKGIDILHAKVANACGAMSYFKKARIMDFYKALLFNLQRIGTHWTKHTAHSDALGDFEDIGGLTYCPDELLKETIKWLILTYIGEPGEQGYYGRNRKVFFSNSAAPIIARLIKSGPSKIKRILKELADDKDIKRAVTNIHVARRFEDLLDMFYDDEEEE